MCILYMMQQRRENSEKPRNLYISIPSRKTGAFEFWRGCRAAVHDDARKKFIKHRRCARRTVHSINVFILFYFFFPFNSLPGRRVVAAIVIAYSRVGGRITYSASAGAGVGRSRNTKCTLTDPPLTHTHS